MRLCCVPLCKNKHNLHRFPVSKSLFDEWKKRVLSPKFEGLDDVTIRNRFMICDLHFADINRDKNTGKLLKYSIPSISVPGFHGPLDKDHCFFYPDSVLIHKGKPPRSLEIPSCAGPFSLDVINTADNLIELNLPEEKPMKISNLLMDDFHHPSIISLPYDTAISYYSQIETNPLEPDLSYASSKDNVISKDTTKYLTIKTSNKTSDIMPPLHRTTSVFDPESFLTNVRPKKLFSHEIMSGLSDPIVSKMQARIVKPRIIYKENEEITLSNAVKKEYVSKYDKYFIPRVYRSIKAMGLRNSSDKNIILQPEKIKNMMQEFIKPSNSTKENCNIDKENYSFKKTSSNKPKYKVIPRFRIVIKPQIINTATDRTIIKTQNISFDKLCKSNLQDKLINHKENNESKGNLNDSASSKIFFEKNSQSKKRQINSNLPIFLETQSDICSLESKDNLENHDLLLSNKKPRVEKIDADFFLSNNITAIEICDCMKMENVPENENDKHSILSNATCDNNDLIDPNKCINILIGCCDDPTVQILPEFLQIIMSKFTQRRDEFFVNVQVVSTKKAESFMRDMEKPMKFLSDQDKDRGMKEDEVCRNLAEWADIMVVLPLDANTMAKITQGFCDNMVTSVIRCWNMSKPLIYCPCMNHTMWNHPVTSSLLETLQGWNFTQGPLFTDTIKSPYLHKKMSQIVDKIDSFIVNSYSAANEIICSA